MRRPATRLLALLPFALAVAPAVAPGVAPAGEPPTPPNPTFGPEIDADQLVSRIACLSDDEMRGRESGTPGGRLAEAYVASEMERFGLEPLGTEAGSPFQTVPMPGRPVLPEECFVEVRVAGEEPDRSNPFQGSIPFSTSKTGDVTAEVVFAGYGLTAADGSYDDWKGLDARGKVALVLRHGPREDVRDSPWSLRGKNVEAMSFAAKAKRAAEAGAAALLVVNDHHHTSEQMPTQTQGGELPIPLVAVPRATANRILRPTGKEIVDFERAIEDDLVPRSTAVPGVTVSLRVTLGDATARNVLFVRRGSDPALRDEAVLLGAHLDHVGLGWFGSPAGPGEIHNGADDNASGTAALLEVAEAIAAGPPTKRSIVFAGWCGEEKGLVGSDHFCRNPAWDLAKVAVCVNLDMLGHYRDDDEGKGLLVVGAPTGTGLEEAVARLAKEHSLRATATWEAWEQSDHFSFYRRKVPCLFLHTGLHPDYHRPGDDWWKIDGRDEARVAAMTADLLRSLADAAERPEFREKPLRPVLGVALADAADDGGAVVTTVYPGLGAAKAGLLPKDVLTSFAGRAVKDSREVLDALAKLEVGAVVDVVWRRGSEEKSARITISGR